MRPPDEHGFLSWVTRLVREHRGGLIATARQEGLPPEEALDVVQEALIGFLDLPHARSLANAKDDSHKLLLVLVRNQARNRRRRHDLSRAHHSEPEVVDGLADPRESVEDLIAQAERHVMAFGCVERLAEVQRRVVTLRLLQDQPGEEVALMLGMSPGNVAVTLHRAKRKLRECLSG